MSRIPKWKLEKTKVKVVFRLQFHATHIPLTGWDKLFISFIPEDTGRVTAKTNKANVRNGTCKWPDPIYETTRLLHDPITKKYDDKFYKLVITTGTSRSNLLGEAYINLADHADASKPVSVELPLEGCNFGTILHVSIQLLTSKTGFREFEQQRETREKGFHIISNPSQEPMRKLDKANATVRLKQQHGELYPLEEMDEAAEDFDGSSIGIDGSSCTSDSLHAEKIEISNTNDVTPMIITINGNQTNEKLPHHHMIHGWSSDFSVDNKLSSLYDENARLRGCLEIAESSLLEMKTEVNALKHLSAELSAETQRFAHEFTSELTSREAVFEEVSALKSECSRIKDELEVLRHYKRMLHLNGRRSENLYDNLDGLILLDKKFKLLSSKMQVRYQEQDLDLISDFDGVDILLQNLKQRAMLSSSGSFSQERDTKQIQLQTLLDQELENKKIMNERVCGLLTELEQAKSELETQKRKMNQKTLHYDAFILELEERNLQTLSELERVKAENSSSLSTISALQSEIEKMSCSMCETFGKLSEEKWLLESVNKDLERKVTESKAVLERICFKYSATVEQLQKDLELVSAQLLSVFETNENLAKMTLEEVPKLLYCRNPKFLKVIDAEKLYKEEPCEAAELHELYDLSLHMSVFAEVLKETLLDKSNLEREMKEKMEIILKSEGFLMQRLEGAFDEIKVLREDLKEKTALENMLQEESLHKTYLKTELDKKTYLINILEENFDLVGERLRTLCSNMGIHSKHSRVLTTLEMELDKKDYLAVISRIEEFQMLAFNEALALNEKIIETEKENSSLRTFMEELGSKLENLQLELQTKTESEEKLLTRNKDLTSKATIMEYKLRDAYTEMGDISKLRDELEKTREEMKKFEGEKEIATNQLQNEITKLNERLKSQRDKELKLEEVVRNLEEQLLHRDDELASFQDNEMNFELDSLRQKVLDLESSHLASEKLESQISTLQSKVIYLDTELCKARERVACARSELHSEKGMREKLEATISELTSLLNEKQEQVLCFSNQKSEINNLMQQIETLESEKASVDNLLLKSEERVSELGAEISSLHSQLAHFQQQGLYLESVKEEREREVSKLTSLLTEKENVLSSFQDREAELTSILLKMSEMESEKRARVEELTHLQTKVRQQETSSKEREREVAELTSILNEKVQELISFEAREAEFAALMQKVSELESENRIRLNELTHLLKKVVDLETLKEEREREVSELTSLLNEKAQELISFEEKDEKLSTLRQKLSEMESENLIREKELTNLQQKALDLETLKEEREREFSKHASLLNEKEQQLISYEEKEKELTALRQKISELESDYGIRLNELTHLEKKVLDLEALKQDGEREVSELTSLLKEKEQQLISFEEKEAELSTLMHKLSEMESERGIRSKELTHLQKKVFDLETLNEEREREFSKLTSLLNEKAQQLISFEGRESELTSLRKKISELESERGIRSNELTHLQTKVLDLETLKEEREREVSELTSLLTDKEKQLVSFEVREAELTTLRLKISETESEKESWLNELSHFQKKILDLETLKVEREREISNLMSLLNEKEHQLAVSFEGREAELTFLRKKLSETETENEIRSKLESKLSEVSSLLDEKQQQLILLKQEIDYLQKKTEREEEEMENLKSSKEEHELTGIVLRSKLLEQHEYIRGLMNKLLDQMLKTEEFKNLSIHLKNQIKTKKESESPPGAAVESLRVAFIKEQCEIKVQELQSQLEISTKHGEDLLIKLQSALDEIELRKKKEASCARRIEELESEKRDFEKAFDEIRAELDCSVMSAECCKEEKSVAEASLRECNLEREKLREELLTVKSQLEGLTSQHTELSSEDQQNFKEGIKRINLELERLREENLETLMPSQREEQHDPLHRGVEDELLKLKSVNQNLSTMFPSFQEIRGKENAIDRVLALELEMAKALQSNSNLEFLFQGSSNDKTTMLRSMRDINELIGDMLNAKRKHEAAESELKEMQSRYTQLSLQLAEVEGERQKLLMKLKNCRSPRKTLR